MAVPVLAVSPLDVVIDVLAGVVLFAIVIALCAILLALLNAVLPAAPVDPDADRTVASEEEWNAEAERVLAEWEAEHPTTVDAGGRVGEPPGPS